MYDFYCMNCGNQYQVTADQIKRQDTVCPRCKGQAGYLADGDSS